MIKNKSEKFFAPISMKGHFEEGVRVACIIDPTHPGHDFLSDPEEATFCDPTLPGHDFLSDPEEVKHVSLGGILCFVPPL